MKCTACGKVFDRGATIVGSNIYCPECGELFDELIDGYEVLYHEAKLMGKPIQDIDEYLEKHKDLINKLKLKPNKVKLLILRRISSSVRMK